MKTITKSLFTKLVNHSFLLFSFILIFSGCKKELEGDNFIEVEPPAEQVNIDLTLIPETDTIKIFTLTDIEYNIETYGLDFNSGYFSLASNTWYFNETNGSLRINPDQYEIGYDTLSLFVGISTGSGSLADELGAENYVLEKKWIVQIENRDPPKLELQDRINNNGYLEYYWPKCDLPSFLSYEIRVGGKEIIITDPNQNFYVDSSYVGGNSSSTLNCNTVGKGGVTSFHSVNYEHYNLSTEHLSLDSFRVKWTSSPFNSKYRFEWGTTNYTNFINTHDTTITLPYSGLGDPTIYRIWITPDHITSWTEGFLKRNSYSTLGSYVLPDPRTNMTCTYNPYSKLLYCNAYEDLYSFDLSSSKVKSSINIPSLHYSRSFSASSASPKVAVISYEELLVYDDNTFSNPFVISHNTRVDNVQLTNNDLVTYLSFQDFYIANTSTQVHTDTVTLSDFSKNGGLNQLSVSKTGNYMGYLSDNGPIVFDIVNGELAQKYVQLADFSSIEFDPLNENRLILTSESSKTLEQRNTEDFSLLKSITMPIDVTIYNIDPVTGYILLNGDDKLYIVDMSTESILLTLPKKWNTFSLYNSHLFSSDGFYLDLTDEL